MEKATKDNDINTLTHGGDVYRNSVKLDFSINLNPNPAPEPIKEAALLGLSERDQYPDPLQSVLRESIAQYEGVSADGIICGNGASELILAAVHAVSPKKALLTAPCYAGYARALAASDAEIEEYRLEEEIGFAIDEGFIECLTEDIDMVFIADPNNPDGRRINPALKMRIRDRCEEMGIVLVIDECFLPLCEAFAEESDCTLTAEKDKPLHQGLLRLRAFTKIFAIPGIRLGYMMSDDTELLGKIRMHLPEWNVSRIAERTGERAARVLSESEYLAESVGLIKKEREYLESVLDGLGIKHYRSDANYILLRSFPGLYDRLLEKGILIRRCSNYSGLDDTFFRIAVRRHEDNAAFAEALSEAIYVGEK